MRTLESGRSYYMDTLDIQLIYIRNRCCPLGWYMERPTPRHFVRIWYVQAGTLNMLVNREPFTLDAETLAVVPANVSLVLCNKGKSTVNYQLVCCAVTLNGVDVFSEDTVIRKQTLSPNTVDTWMQMASLFGERKVGLSLSDIKQIRLAGLARLWLADMLDISGIDIHHHVDRIDPRIRLCLDLMKMDLQGHMNLSELARRVSLSPSHLRHLFATTLGISYTRVKEDMRIKKAKQLLITSDLLISEIAGNVGYSNVHHFSNAFKSYEGVSPSNYRKHLSDLDNG